MNKHTKKRKSFKLTKWFLSISQGWRIVLALLTLSGAAAVVLFAFICIQDVQERIAREKYYVSKPIGSRYELRSYYHGSDRIGEHGKRRSLVKGVDWVAGDSSDSLWVVASGGRRAYFNSNTGRLLSPFIYRKAWFYSEGLAAVVDFNYRLCFLDTQGNPAFARSFWYKKENDCDYVFKKGLCQAYDSLNHVGLINRSGEWVVAPEYESMSHEGTYWVFMRADSLTVLDSAGHTVIGMRPGQQLHITDDGDLEVWQQRRPACLYNTEGEVVAKQTYNSLSQLTYYEDDTEINTGMLVYQTSFGSYGLMTADGQVLTDAVYSEIVAYGRDLFRAEYECDCCFSYILLNNKGQLVEK